MVSVITLLVIVGVVVLGTLLPYDPVRAAADAFLVKHPELMIH